MKYVKECAILFAVTLAGELLNHVLPLPVPAGVYGLFLLLILLCSGILKLSDIEATGNFLLDIMPVLFIPAGVGLIESYEEMRAILVPLGVICLASTVIVMAVTGKVADAALRRGKKGTGKNETGKNETGKNETGKNETGKNKTGNNKTGKRGDRT